MIIIIKIIIIMIIIIKIIIIMIIIILIKNIIFIIALTVVVRSSHTFANAGLAAFFRELVTSWTSPRAVRWGAF